VKEKNKFLAMVYGFPWANILKHTTKTDKDV
jgi:hypothetical protein